MSLNHTATWLKGNLSTALIQFSGSVISSNTMLNGPGGASGDGFPIPQKGLIRSMTIWDGSNLHTVTLDFPIWIGSRISIACTYDGGSSSFIVALLHNFTSTPLSLNGLPPNSTYYCTVELLLKENA